MDIDKLPVEIVMNVLSFLYPRDLRSVCLASVHLYNLCKDDSIWKNLSHKIYKLSYKTCPNNSWFDEFFNIETRYRLTVTQRNILTKVKRYFPSVFKTLCNFGDTYTTHVTERPI